MNLVVPSEYVSFLVGNLKFHYLDDNSTTLNTIDDSDFNIIVSNTQKIILKEVHKEKTAIDKLMNEQLSLELEGLDDFTKELYGNLDDLKDDREVTMNQRFQKIIRLKQLGVYVDEAHHLFGTDLQTSLSDSTKETSLRYTINYIARVLERNSTKLVACYNYTGTPYVENRVLPEVVYSYGLKAAIDNHYLKQVEIKAYENVKNEEFLRKVLKDFFEYHGNELYEGLKPKIAIFGAEIKEVVEDIKPLVEGILNDLGVDLSTILVNVGDSTITKDADIQDFNNLDVVGTEGSKKQVLLLVNKGREGWNCRSLFSVALFRSPKSKVFVLQSTMRCLRSITETQQLAHVYLSIDNYKILDDELRKNFNVDIMTVTSKPLADKKEYVIRIVEPVKMLNLEEIKKTYELEKKDTAYTSLIFEVKDDELKKYESARITKMGLDDTHREIRETFVSEDNRQYSKYSLVFEISRYLNEDPFVIENILNSTGKFDLIVEQVSKYNDILYERLIPAIFNHMYSVKEKTETESKLVPLIKYPKGMDHFIFKSTKGMTLQKDDAFVVKYSGKSFHIDRYVFDSEPEKELFYRLLQSPLVKEVYFTGMFTGSENGLSVQYIDPESNIIRNYYPDILVYYTDGSIEIIEVKGDNKIDNAVVNAKAYAAMDLAEHSKMEYNMVKSSEIMDGSYKIKGE
ncbi:MAG: type III restriction endonuclease [Bacilli bacterium]|nr:type III restriction endonuclease [Bacilli bacterium]MCI6215578.1 type III restriction endonuclease [Mollicutes bacterium]